MGLSRKPISVFELGSRKSGVANLDPYLTLNGATKTPIFRYKGGDANASNWPAWQFGPTLALQSGTAPSYNQGSPLMGDNDDSVKFNNRRGYARIG